MGLCTRDGGFEMLGASSEMARVCHRKVTFVCCLTGNPLLLSVPYSTILTLPGLHFKFC